MQYPLLRLDRKALRDAVERLYDSGGMGAEEVADFLAEGFRRELLEEASHAKFRSERTRYGSGVETNYEICPSANELKKARFLRDAYRDALFDSLEGFLPFIPFNSIEMVRYRPGGYITSHRDSRAHYLISLFPLQGEDPLSVSRERGGQGIELLSIPGSLVLLRAPRPGEGEVRPFHSVGPVRSERYVIGLRQTRISLALD